MRKELLSDTDIVSWVVKQAFIKKQSNHKNQEVILN